EPQAEARGGSPAPRAPRPPAPRAPVPPSGHLPAVLTTPPLGSTPLRGAPYDISDPPARMGAVSPASRPPGSRLLGRLHLPQLLLQVGDLVAQPGRQLELQLLGGGPHLGVGLVGAGGGGAGGSGAQ